MIVLSEYSTSLKKSAGAAYLKRMEEAARLINIQIINFEQQNIEYLEAELDRHKDRLIGESAFWLGYVPTLEAYKQVDDILQKYNIQLLNSSQQFARSEYFDQFYPFIEEDSIKSGVATTWDDAKRIALEIDYPIFLKGTIQSLKKFGWNLCVAKNEKELSVIFDRLKKEQEFSLGKVILRKFIHLNHLEVGGNGIPKAHEYRFFVFNHKIIDFSYYWNGENPFQLSNEQELMLRSMVLRTAKKVAVPFISVDVGETESGQWKVIEIGDGQFSDIRNIPPLKLWNLLSEESKIS